MSQCSSSSYAYVNYGLVAISLVCICSTNDANKYENVPGAIGYDDSRADDWL